MIWDENVRSIETEILLSVATQELLAPFTHCWQFCFWATNTLPDMEYTPAAMQADTRELILEQHPVLTTYQVGASIAAFKATHGTHFLIERKPDENSAG